MDAQHRSTRPARPPSAVSAGVGLAGLAGLFFWVTVSRQYGMDGSWSALANLFACGIPMVLWSLLVDKVHLRGSTGIDWSHPRPVRDVVDVSLVKIAGLWVTWGVIGVFYCIGRWYWRGNYLFSMEVFQAAVPLLLALSVPYVLWLDRYLKEPRDGAWHFGTWLIGQSGWDAEEIRHHARAWTVKGFFLAFMFSIVPGGFAHVVNWATVDILSSPMSAANWLISLMFLIDVAFATVGYLLTMKPLDAHIRTANPHMQGWVAALMCYPPFVLMVEGGVLYYQTGTWGDASWTHWLEGSPVLLAIWGTLLVMLTGVYAWATVAFGLRFSNLTHRGIITNGPYAFTKHPAYLSKNSFWWLSTLPFLVTTGSMIDAVRNTVTLALVSGVYYWRARTEEKHLLTDPAYAAYADWMEAHAPIPRLIRWITGRGPKVAVPAE
jgi:hypothetical protein